MATRTWTGSSNTNWYTPTNWSGTLPPGINDVAYLNATGIRANIAVSVIGPVSVGTIRWNTSSADHATIDISGGSLIVGSPTGGVIFAGVAAYGTIKLENTGSGSTLQLGTSTRFADAVSTVPQIVFANDGTASATLVWDSATTLVAADLTLTNFAAHDYLKIDATGAPGSLSYSAGVLTFKIGSKTYSVGLAHTPGASDYQTSDFHIAAAGGVVTITSDYPCFLRGTRIATLCGEVAVEDLRIGDLVVTATGGALPIKWIGTRDFIAALVQRTPPHRPAAHSHRRRRAR